MVAAHEECSTVFPVEGELLVLYDAIVTDVQGADWGFDWMIGWDGWHIGFLLAAEQLSEISNH